MFSERREAVSEIPIETRGDPLDRFWGNGVSKRYVIRTGVYDQRERRFIPKEEWDTVKADELMRLR